MKNSQTLRGRLISIEGTEGAGKSTALQSIQAFFETANQNILLTREPGGTSFAEAIRKLLLDPSLGETVSAETELLLMFASRAQHIQHIIVPALQSGSWVISDRYIDASYAYQGGGRGVAKHLIQTLDKFIVGNLYPELTILLDIDPAIGLKRAEQRNGTRDRIEQEKLDFFNRVRAAYLERAQQDPRRVKIIDANQSLAAVNTQIQAILSEFTTRNT